LASRRMHILSHPLPARSIRHLREIPHHLAQCLVAFPRLMDHNGTMKFFKPVVENYGRVYRLRIENGCALVDYVRAQDAESSMLRGEAEWRSSPDVLLELDGQLMGWEAGLAAWGMREHGNVWRRKGAASKTDEIAS
jgi:hypothetical protein